MNPRTSAHPAGEALAAVRAENPQLADKLKLATGPAEQLGLFAAAQDAPPKAVSLGLKDHDWDRQHPISKTAYSVVYFCTRCNVRMRANLGTRPQYRAEGVTHDGLRRLIWSDKRPVCIPKPGPSTPPDPGSFRRALTKAKRACRRWPVEREGAGRGLLTFKLAQFLTLRLGLTADTAFEVMATGYNPRLPDPYEGELLKKKISAALESGRSAEAGKILRAPLTTCAKGGL